MTRIVDLETLSADELNLIWEELQRHHAAREADPVRYDFIVKSLEEGVRVGRLKEPEAAEIRAQLDDRGYSPGAVLSGHLTKIIPDRLALGAFPPSTHFELLRDLPRLLIVVMARLALVESDEDFILELAARFAESAGISDAVAEEIMADGLQSLRTIWRKVAENAC
jgi:hypothetical protein